MPATAPNQGILRFPAQATNLSLAINAFLVDCQARRLSPATVERYYRELDLFQRWLEGLNIRGVTAITADHLRQYLVQLAKRRNAGGQHLGYRTLRCFLRWYAVEYEPDDWQNPIAKVRPPKLSQDILPPVSLDDLRRMLATCQRRTFAGARDRAVLLALLDTGCRASEFVALDVGDVDISTGAVSVRRGKGGKARVTFLGAKTRRELLRYLRHRQNVPPGAPLWATTEGERLTYWGLRQIMRRRAEAAGVETPSLHAFRRAFAILSLRGGMDLETLRRLLGHSDLSVIKRYLAQTREDLRQIHERSGPVDNLL